MIRTHNFLALGALLLLAAPRILAQTTELPPVPPPDTPDSTYKPAPILRTTLPNGLRVVIQENHRIPAVQMEMGIDAGLVADPIDMPFMTSLAVQMIAQGTEKYNPEKREKAALAMGGDLGISLQKDYVNVSANCLSNHFDQMLDLMADMILYPKLDRDLMDAITENAINNYKNNRVKSERDESKGRHAYTVHYPTRETVKKLDRDHLFEFLENYYCPNNSVLVICGDVDAAAALKQIKSAFGTWKRGNTPPLPPFVPEKIEPFYYILLLDEPHAVETNIQMSVEIPGLEEKDRVALQLANVIMGETLDSRLFRTVREKYGYVYSIQSGVSFDKYATNFYILTECRAAVTAKTVKQIEIEVARLREEPVSAEELEQAKHYLTHKFEQALQSQERTMDQLFEIEFYNRPADYFHRLQGKINALTALDVLNVAKKYMFPNGSAFIDIVGPKERVVDRLMNANVGVVLNPDTR